MFAGHYAPALALRARFVDTPLWVLFLAAQAVDVMFFIMVPLGLERMHVEPTRPGFLALDLEYMPWSHSLAMTAFYAGTVALLVRGLGRKTLWSGVAIGLAILSHWFGDLIVHRPDLPMAPGADSVGLGLWHYPIPAFALEVGLVAAGLWMLRARLSPRAAQLATFLCLALVIAHTLSAFVIPPPGNVYELAVASQLVFLLFTLGAWRVDVAERIASVP